MMVVLQLAGRIGGGNGLGMTGTSLQINCPFCLSGYCHKRGAEVGVMASVEGYGGGDRTDGIVVSSGDSVDG